MHEAVLAQELERAIGGNRRRPRPLEREPLDDLVGTQRLMRVQSRGQHLAADWRQALATLYAQHLGHGHRITGAAIMVMVGCREDGPPPNRRVARSFRFRHARIFAVLLAFRSCCAAIIVIAMQQFHPHMPNPPREAPFEQPDNVPILLANLVSNALTPRSPRRRARLGARARAAQSRSISRCRAAAPMALSRTRPAA